MGEAIRHGGWGMYPTLIAGLVLVGCALRYAASPSAVRALLVRRLGLLTLFAGALGTLAGIIRSCRHAVEGGALQADLVVGIGESLHCVAAAVCSLVIAQLAVCIGTARLDRDAAELTDPHQPT